MYLKNLNIIIWKPSDIVSSATYKISKTLNILRATAPYAPGCDALSIITSLYCKYSTSPGIFYQFLSYLPSYRIAFELYLNRITNIDAHVPKTEHTKSVNLYL